jgi:DeoR family transcriptional regulator, suf operon transcriptional repressor
MGTPVIPQNSPAGRVLAHLRHGPMTVEELARAMRVTPNAVRNQLSKLQESNLVIRAGTRPGVSKPSSIYAITLEGQTQFSTIYLPVLTQFFRVGEEKCSPQQLDAFMTETGRQLAARFARPTGDLKTRVRSAARLLKSIGGIPEVRTRNGSFVIQSLGCPLSALTSENEAACKVIEGLISSHIGVPALTCCVREPDPRCRFEIDRKKERAAAR